MKKVIALTLICSILLGGCTSSQKDVEMQAPASASVAPETREIPPELIEWVKNSGWDIPEEMFHHHSMPIADNIAKEHPEQFTLPANNYVYERQQGNSCGGYSSAYLLRYLGEDVSGQDVYDALDFKITDGLLLPQGIVDYFTSAGHPVTLYQGSIDQLKARLNNGAAPIIVLVGNSVDMQHYITLLGYDAENLYFFDSNRPENPDMHYNSVLSTEEFAPLWENIIPGFKRIYFVLDS